MCVFETRSHSVAKASHPGTHYLAQAGLKLVTILSCLSILGAGTSVEVPALTGLPSTRQANGKCFFVTFFFFCTRNVIEGHIDWPVHLKEQAFKFCGLSQGFI